MCHTVFRTRTVLGRVFVGTFVSAVGGFFEAEHPEAACAPHGGEGLFEELAVERVAVVLPEVRAVPGIGNHVVVHEAAHAAEDVVFRVAGPAFALSGSLGVSLPLVVVGGHVDDIVEERHVHFAQVGGFGGPVVHLHVDVRVDIGVPCGFAAVVPDTLQVGGEVHAARAGDFEVAAVGEIELLDEERIVFAARAAVAVGIDEHVGGVDVLCAFELEGAAVEVALIVGHVARVEFAPRLAGGSVYRAFHLAVEACGVRYVVGGVSVEVCAAAENDEHLVGIFNYDALRGGGHRAACGHNLHAGVVRNGFECAGEGGISTVVRSRGADAGLTGSERDAQRHLAGLVGLVAHGNHAVGVGGNIFARVIHRLVGALELHAGRGVFEVEVAIVVLHGLVCAERAAEVFHEDAAEVFVVAVFSAVVGVLAAPEGLLVKLDFVLGDAAEEAGAELSVADRQGVFHPLVGNIHAAGGFLVPERELVLGGERGDAFHGEGVNNRHLRGIYEEERVVFVARVPKADRVPGRCAAPLVEIFVRERAVRLDFISTGIGAVGRGDDAEARGVGCAAHHEQVARLSVRGRLVALHVDIVSVLAHDLEVGGIAHEFPKVRGGGAGRGHAGLVARAERSHVIAVFGKLNHEIRLVAVGAEYGLEVSGLHFVEIHRVVRVACVPFAELCADTRAAPLVHALCRAAALDFPRAGGSACDKFKRHGAAFGG